MILPVCEHFEENMVQGYQRSSIKLWVGDPPPWLVPNIEQIDSVAHLQ